MDRESNIEQTQWAEREDFQGLGIYSRKTILVSYCHPVKMYPLAAVILSQKNAVSEQPGNEK